MLSRANTSEYSPATQIGFTNLAFSPDGGTLASVCRDEIHLRDAVTGVHKQILKEERRWFASVTFSPDGRTIAGGNTDNTIRLWDAATGAPKLTLRGHTGEVTSVAFSPDGGTLASGSADGTVLLWSGASYLGR